MALAELPGPYDVRAYSCRARGVATHTCTMAPYRGVSRPVITFAIERLMDKAAAAFAFDPVEIRKRNLIRRFPYTSATGLVFDEGSYVETLEQAAAHIDLPAFRARQREARARGRFLGIGFATFSERTGYGSPAFAARGMEITPGWETVEVVMDPSGHVEARIGASPHGQGLDTTLAQLVADEVGVAPHDVRVVHGDTDRTPYGWGTFASRSLVISGGADALAARKIREKLLIIASHVLEAAPDDIVLENGSAKVSGTDRAVTIADARARGLSSDASLQGRSRPALRESAHYDPPGTFSNACHVAIVEVDIETGRVRVEKFLAVEDAGRIINPLIADGQVHGGIAQGIGNALFEEIIYDQLGNIQTATLADYHAADGARNSADRIAPHRNAGGVFGHRRQRSRRRRHDRRAGRDHQRRQRRALAVRRLDRRNAGNAAAHPRGARSGIRNQNQDQAAASLIDLTSDY